MRVSMQALMVRVSIPFSRVERDRGGDCCSDLEERVAELEGCWSPSRHIAKESSSAVVRNILNGMKASAATIILLLAFLLFLNPPAQPIAFFIEFTRVVLVPVLVAPYFLTGPPVAF